MRIQGKIAWHLNSDVQSDVHWAIKFSNAIESICGRDRILWTNIVYSMAQYFVVCVFWYGG